MQAIKDWHKSHPHLIVKSPRNHPGRDTYGTYVYAFPIQQLVANFGVVSHLANIALALPATLVCAVLASRRGPSDTA